MPLLIEETPGGPLVRSYVRRDGTGRATSAALVRADNLDMIAAWSGGRVFGKSVIVPDPKAEGFSWTAAIGSYVVGGDEQYPVWGSRDFESTWVLESVRAADEWARRNVLDRVDGAS